MDKRLFEKNIDALRVRHLELADRLRGHVPSPKYRMVPSISKQWDLLVQNGSQERLLHGVPNPVEESLSYWRNKKLRNPAMMLFLGLDLGYRLFTYLQQPNPNTQCYLLVEKDVDIFWHMIHILDISEIAQNKDFYFIVGESDGGLFLKAREFLSTDLRFTMMNAISVENGSTSYQLNKEYYKSFLVTLRNAIEDLMINAGNAPHDAFWGVRHMLLNVDTIARTPGIKDLFGKFAGKPGIVVATGPSLDKNYHLLHEVQNRAVIACADASLRFLLNEGIKPHFVAALERTPTTVPFFKKLEPELCKDTYQVAVPVVVPEVYSEYPGPKVLMYRPYLHFQWLENDKGTVFTGPSCANMAFKLLEMFGCDPIILVGQDLAYGEDDSTHSKAAPWGKVHEPEQKALNPTIRVRGNYKKWVYTRPAWETMRLAYVRDVAGYKGTVINATEGGAYIDGTLVMSLREAIDHHIGPQFPVLEEIRTNLRIPTEGEVQEYLRWLYHERIPTTIQELEHCINTAQNILDSGKEIYLSSSTAPDDFTLFLNRSLSFGYSFFMRDTIASLAALDVIQPAFVRLLTDHHHIPKLYSSVDEINKKRVSLHIEFLDDTIKMLAILKNLYKDPNYDISSFSYEQIKPYWIADGEGS